MHLTDEQSNRLNFLWRRAKVGWTYAEALAGLWAFKRTREGQISRLANSPVALAALRTGRVMQGMYNKVQHFRAMDSNDPRTGLTSNSVVDRTVWARFFDPDASRLRDEDIETEFERLWPDAAFNSLPPRSTASVVDIALADLSLEDLIARYLTAVAGRPPRPRTFRSNSIAFDRDPLVGAIARVRADNRCEAPGCSVPLFLTRDGGRFVEVHHIEALAAGGFDTPENVACLCPNHHREAHHGEAAAELGLMLRKLRTAEPAARRD